MQNMKISEYNLGFVGFGHLAKVICQAIDRSKLLSHSQVFFTQRDPHKMRENEQKYKIQSMHLDTLVEKSDILLLAVRPNQAEGVLKQLADLGAGKKKIITVMAGLKFSYYQKFLGKGVDLLRTMPNLASSVGEGMTVLSYVLEASPELKSFGNVFFQMMGAIIELDESLLDISVGVSGSGPGFVFVLIEAMARAGAVGGIPYEKALVMAAQTFLGAARLIQKGSSPESLLRQIAVPNGTTEAGLAVLKSRSVVEHFQEAIFAATHHSKQISEEFR
jgi:pyrroline-5-carboxylate reductase